MQMLQED